MTRRVRTVTVRRRCWRVLAPRWSHEPLSGAGSARNGGRFNRPGASALYLSEDLLTAVAEYEQDLGIRPGTFCAYELDVAGVVDLTDEAVRRACGVTVGELQSDWKTSTFIENRTPRTWLLADDLIGQNRTGIRAPSARNPSGVNVILWRWNDHPRRRVVANDPQGDLPRDQFSWRS